MAGRVSKATRQAPVTAYVARLVLPWYLNNHGLDFRRTTLKLSLEYRGLGYGWCIRWMVAMCSKWSEDSHWIDSIRRKSGRRAQTNVVFTMKKYSENPGNNRKNLVNEWLLMSLPKEIHVTWSEDVETRKSDNRPKFDGKITYKRVVLAVE
jgi:hypothetical protein